MKSYMDYIIICDFDRDILLVKDGELDRSVGKNGRLGKGRLV